MYKDYINHLILHIYIYYDAVVAVLRAVFAFKDLWFSQYWGSGKLLVFLPILMGRSIGLQVIAKIFYDAIVHEALENWSCAMGKRVALDPI